MYRLVNKLINNKILMITAMILVIAFVVCLPELRSGVYGFNKDVLYHVFRIEGLKDCIQNGEFPAKIYRNFFDGYGYGSPMFYPDIFLIPASLLRIIGVGISSTYKLYILLITVIASFTTYYSARVITSDWKMSCLATYMVMLSQFYLANIVCRAGLSEYLGYIFMPLVFAGIYDFFCNDGKRVYLLGIGFGGMILSHTLLAFLGGIITVGFFIVGIIIDIKNKKMSQRKNQYIRLFVTALCTVLIVGFYLFPMIEQLLSVEMGYRTPWTFVGDNTQPFYTLFSVTGYFFNIAYVGIGIPLIILAAVKIYFGLSKNVWCEIFYFAGIALFLATTRLVPWHLLNNTVFNSIQFTFRLYPYAIFALTMGSVMHLSRLNDKNIVKNLMPRVIIIFSALSVIFGAWENIYLMNRPNEPDFYTELSAVNLDTTYEVGQGKEWLPVKAKDVYNGWSRSDRVKTDGVDIDYNRDGKDIEFEADGTANEYVCPLTYYKGYKAVLTAPDNSTYELPVEESDTGQVKVTNNTASKGTIRVYYANTPISIVSLVVSVITIVLIIVYAILKKRGIAIVGLDRKNKK